MSSKKGFTLLEVLVVIIIIGILAALGWSNLNDLIQTNKAKEAARTMVSFAERAVAEGKTRKEAVEITVTGNTIKAEPATSHEFSQSLADGFLANTDDAPGKCEENFYNSGITSQVKIGISGINGPGCFVVCNTANYCGSAVKIPQKNTFTAYIKKKNSDAWEEL